MTAMAFLDRVRKIFSSRIAMVIYAVAIGVIAWLLVTDATNPSTEATLTVEVKFINSDVLAEKQLALSTDSRHLTAEINVSGRQSVLKKLRTDDITLTIDLSGINDAGKHVKTANVPECAKYGVKIIDFTPKEFTVEIVGREEVSVTPANVTELNCEPQ